MYFYGCVLRKKIFFFSSLLFRKRTSTNVFNNQTQMSYSWAIFQNLVKLNEGIMYKGTNIWLKIVFIYIHE